MGAGLKQGAEMYCPTCEQTFAGGERCPSDNTRLVRIAEKQDELIGRDLDGRYTIVEQLGEGGMGAVYRGTQHQLGREVAIKVVTPSLVKEPIAIKRFLREAKLASRLSHPNAVSVLDFGQTEDGLFFLVMELVTGRTLEALVHKEGKLTPARVVRIGAQICDALEGAHALQIIHRDLKPQNVMVMTTGRDLVKVLDFGLAKSLTPEQGKTTMTNAGALLGTPAFMPPELVLGQDCDARADLYSLGCVLYVLASGRVPFPSASVHEVIAMHASEPPPKIEGIPYKLWRVIERLLEKDPDDRFKSATATREMLEGALVDRPDTEDAVPTLHASSSTVLGWESRPNVQVTPVPGRARIATPMGIPKVSIGTSSVDADEAELLGSNPTMPSEALAAAMSSISAASAPPAVARSAVAPPKRLGWKPIALVAAAALAAAVVAFVVVDGGSKRAATKVSPAPAPAAVDKPAAPSPPPAVVAPAAASSPVVAPAPPVDKPVPPVDKPASTVDKPAAPIATPATTPIDKPAPAVAVDDTAPKKTVKRPTKKPATPTTKPAEPDKPAEPVLRRPVKTNPGVM